MESGPSVRTHLYHLHADCLYEIILDNNRIDSVQVTLSDGVTIARRNWSQIPNQAKKQLLLKIKKHGQKTQSLGEEKT